MKWNYNLYEAPADIPILLLSADDCPLLPQKIFMGTITYNYKGELTRGECLIGDPDYFYRSEMVAWKNYFNWRLEVYMHSPKEIYEWLERIHFYIEDPKSDSKVQLMEYMQDLKTYIGAFEQIKWERDVAIQQLHDLGYELGITNKKTQI